MESGPRPVSSQTLADHLALFTRWFYRPTVKSSGEMVFAGQEGEVPRKPLLRAISRVAARASSANPEELTKPPIQWHS
jgi:excinuclease ABC subunit C